MWLSRKKQATPAPAPAVSINPYLHDVGAARLQVALLKRDWSTARDILVSAPSSDMLSFYMRITADTPGVQDWIEGPVRDEPDSVWPLLVRGAHAVYWAWEARGGGAADTVSREAWNVWFDRLRQAENSLDAALEIDPNCAEAWHYLIILGRARQLPAEERWRRFEGLLAADPHHLFGHEQMLTALMAKWSGSDEEMFEFARSRAAANPGTLIPVLVARAHFEYADRHYEVRNDHFGKDEVGEEVMEAARASIWHPDYKSTLLAATAWNTFAMALTLADYFESANIILDTIADDWICEYPWGSVEECLRLRAAVKANLD
jgi:hypothetical protein